MLPNAITSRDRSRLDIQMEDEMDRYEVIDMPVVSCTDGGHVRAVKIAEGAARPVREWTVPEIWTAIYQGQVFSVRAAPQQGVRVLATEYCRGWGTLCAIDSEPTEGYLTPQPKKYVPTLPRTPSRGL